MEKQLQGAVTPQMPSKKSSHTSQQVPLKSLNVGSTGNIHGLIQTQESPSGSPGEFGYFIFPY